MADRFLEEALMAMDPERMRDFICAMDKGNADYLDKLEKEAIEDDVPIIRKDMQSLLKFLLALSHPLNILEVGTATGFSALLMAEYSDDPAVITTIEKYEKRIPVARQHFDSWDKKKKITLLEGDAADVLKGLNPGYDFVFMDAAKGQYENFLPEVMRVLKKGGLLVTDNVLQDGDIVQSRFAVTRRNRTIHARMREYIYDITHRDDLQTVILNTGDGVTLSVKTR
ncbi:O-methyltransferase [Butyrivibrio sp.]|uniref:O-methyltransferase n=1 Tax=Butyrivibrio sp. TaxID=28121 RepID=UPI002ED16998